MFLKRIRYIAVIGLIALFSTPALADVEIWLNFNRLDVANSVAPSGIPAGQRYFFEIQVVVDDADIANPGGSVWVTAPWGIGTWSVRALADSKPSFENIEWELSGDEILNLGFRQSHASLLDFNAAITGQPWTVDISDVTGSPDIISFEVAELEPNDWLANAQITNPPGDARTGPLPLVEWEDNGLSAVGSDATHLDIDILQLASLVINFDDYDLSDPKPWPTSHVPDRMLPACWNAMAVAYGRIGAANNIQNVSTEGNLDWAITNFEFSGHVIFIEVRCPCSDTDGDGVLDDADNCLAVANSGQRDTDGDNIGNICDPDIALPNDCAVNFLDLDTMKEAFFSNPTLPGWNPDADLDGDDLVNFADLVIMQDRFFGPPGPSALPNACGL